MTTTPPLKILLVDDHEVVRRGLSALLETRPGWTVVGEASDGRTAVRMARETEADVVIMDIGMPELNGFEATRKIRKSRPEAELLVLSMHESEQLVREIIGAGARGYVLKSDAGRDLIAAVEALSRHEPFFTSHVAAKVFQLANRQEVRKRGRKPQAGLTRREREIIQLLAEGHNNREIADRLGISVKTAETHRSRLMRKLDVTSLAALVRYAIREQIVQA